MIGCLQKRMPINLASYSWKTIRDSNKVLKYNHRMKLFHDKSYLNCWKFKRKSHWDSIIQPKKKKKDIRGEVHTQDLCLHSFWIFFYWCMFVYRLSESPCAVLCCLLVEVISQTHLQAFWSLAQVGHVEGRIGIWASNDNNIHIFCKGDCIENEAFMKT